MWTDATTVELKRRRNAIRVCASASSLRPRSPQTRPMSLWISAARKGCRRTHSRPTRIASSRWPSARRDCTSTRAVYWLRDPASTARRAKSCARMMSSPSKAAWAAMSSMRLLKRPGSMPSTRSSTAAWRPFFRRCFNLRSLANKRSKYATAASMAGERGERQSGTGANSLLHPAAPVSLSRCRFLFYGRRGQPLNRILHVARVSER